MSEPSTYPQRSPGASLRCLPDVDVTDDTIADAYAQFILYCNPHFPLDIDTTELKRIFRCPPRSDGKDFSIFVLWELITKFETKEIKTWAQLALDLGVEPPSAEKGGSVQKVQQYSVRLKRWMRAMHVDAFFEFLLHKRHPYFLNIPPPHDPHPAQGRDGVPAEEDLAIRALDPSFRPKRGRKRNESPDEEPAPSKRPLLTTSFTFEGQTLYAQPQSAHPESAIPLRARPDNFIQDPWAAASAVTPESYAQRSIAPHSAVSARPPQHLQWNHRGPQDTPMTPHPMSAIESGRPYAMAYDEPRSAITASANRPRRKHGPAVSSAWPSSSATSRSKLRGRPPVNRSVQDGSFSTFPVDPNVERTPSSQRSTPVIALAPVRDERSPLLRPNTYTMSPNRRESHTGLVTQGKPERLQVQVPPHTGGPIRLATPTLMLNGEFNDANMSGGAHRQEDWQDEDAEEGAEDEDEDVYDEDLGTPQSQPQSQNRLHSKPNTTPTPAPNSTPSTGFAYEALRRILAADLLRAKTTHSNNNNNTNAQHNHFRILSSQANRLASAMLTRLDVPRADTISKKDDALRMAAASWLGVSHQLGFQAGTPCHEKEIVVHHFDGSQTQTQTPLQDDENATSHVHAHANANATAHANASASSMAGVSEKYDVSWSLGFGGVGGRFAVIGLVLEPEVIDPDDPEAKALEIMKSVQQQQQQGREAGAGERSGAKGDGDGNGDVDWKARFMALDVAVRLMKGQVNRLQDRVLDAIL